MIAIDTLKGNKKDKCARGVNKKVKCARGSNKKKNGARVLQKPDLSSLDLGCP